MQQQEVPKEAQDAAAAGTKDQQLQGVGQVGAPDVQEDNLFDMQEDPAATPAAPAAKAGDQQHPDEEGIKRAAAMTALTAAAAAATTA